MILFWKYNEKSVVNLEDMMKIHHALKYIIEHLHGLEGILNDNSIIWKI